MENTQYNFSLSEQRLCDFFGKKARARRQERRCKRSGGQEQVQQSVSATEYVDQEEDKEVTVETLTEKRDAIQAKMDKAGDDFSNTEGIMTAKGYYEAADELNKFYQEEYLKQVAEHEGELYEAYIPIRAKHKEAQDNPIYQKQIVQQCGRCQYYRWILVRRQKEMDEYERQLDGLLDKYDDVVNGLIRELDRETDRVENETYEEVTVTITNATTGEERIETVDIQEEVEETLEDIDEIVAAEESEEEGVSEGAEIVTTDETVETVAERLVGDNGQETGETIIENVETEIKHNFLDQLKEPEAQTLMEAGVEAGKDDIKIMEELSKKYEVKLNDAEEAAVKKEIAKFRKAREIREHIEKDYSPAMKKFKDGVGEWIGKWDIARSRSKGKEKEKGAAMVDLLREVYAKVPEKGTGPEGKICLQDVVDFKDWLSNKKTKLRNENFELGKGFSDKSKSERVEIERRTEVMHTQIRYLNIYLAKLSEDFKEADYNEMARKRDEAARL